MRSHRGRAGRRRPARARARARRRCRSPLKPYYPLYSSGTDRALEARGRKERTPTLLPSARVADERPLHIVPRDFPPLARLSWPSAGGFKLRCCRPRSCACLCAPFCICWWCKRRCTAARTRAAAHQAGGRASICSCANTARLGGQKLRPKLRSTRVASHHDPGSNAIPSALNAPGVSNT